MTKLPFPVLIFRGFSLKERALEDIEALKAFDPKVEEKINSLGPLLNEARLIPEHRVSIKNQTRITDQVALARDAALDEVKRLRYFISENFGEDPDFNAAFQFRYVNEIRRNDARLLHLLDGFNQRLPEFAERLAGVGYGENRVQGFTTALNNYHDKSLLQSKAKADTLNATAHRRQITDEIYSILVNVCAIGKMVFENIPSRYEHYLLIDRPAGTGGEPELSSLELTVHNAQGQPLAGITFQLLETDFADLTDDEGLGSFEEVPAGSYTLRLTATGFAMHEQQVTLVNDQTLDVAVTLTEA